MIYIRINRKRTTYTMMAEKNFLKPHSQSVADVIAVFRDGEGKVFGNHLR